MDSVSSMLQVNCLVYKWKKRYINWIYYRGATEFVPADE